MTVEVNRWLNQAQAARRAGCFRGTIRAAIRRGDLTAYCVKCQNPLALAEVTTDGHLCPKVPRFSDQYTPQRYPIMLKASDIRRFSMSPTHQAAGKASARARRAAAKAKVPA